MFRNNASNAQRDAAQMEAAMFELKTISDMYQKMSAACFRKCVLSLSEAELNVGELSCTDRCVAKYLQAQEKVGAKFQEANEAAMSAAQQPQ